MNESKECLRARFWEKVAVGEIGDCWEWSGAKTAFGHGRFRVDGILVSPHRLVMEWVYGAVPDKKLVLHTCDNAACVNPNHLYIGTHRDNVLDAVCRGRCSWMHSRIRSDGYVRCNRCRRYLPPSAFYRGPMTSAYSVNGRFNTRCKSCEHKRRKIRYTKTGK